MKTQPLNLIYFSPTGTTKKILETIGENLNINNIKDYNITKFSETYNFPDNSENAVTIIGSPVYGGRIPVDAVKRLGQFKTDNSPAILVVVYGNRAYEDSLRELRDIAIQNGFKIIGAAAFIGEHSYSTAKTLLAEGRPDKADLSLAKKFAFNLNNKLNKLTSLDNIESLKIPGNYPYKEKGIAPVISPDTKESICTLCKTCEMVCPTNAVTVADSVITDKNLCIWCSACIKSCPENARFFDSPVIDKITKKLVNLCSEYREPEFFF